MAMLTCPYCNMEISMSALEAEDGYCPECGAVIGGTSIFEDDESEDELDEEVFKEEPEEDIGDIEIEDIEDIEEFEDEDMGEDGNDEEE